MTKKVTHLLLLVLFTPLVLAADTPPLVDAAWLSANLHREDHAVLGNRDARLYDGSTMKWARRPDLPLTQHIRLCTADFPC
jgi:hypothetical protein